MEGQLMNWDDEAIEEKLLESAEPPIILVGAAADLMIEMRDEYESTLEIVTGERDELLTIVENLKATIVELEEELGEVRDPADVRVTVGPGPIATSNFIPAMQDVDSALRTGAAASREAIAKVKTVMATHIMNFGAPNLWPNEADGRITNWARLDERMNMFLNMGQEPALIFYNFPHWMKEKVLANGVIAPMDPNDPFSTEGRVAWEKIDKFRQYCKEICRRYMVGPYHARIMVFLNEFKGYYYRRTGESGLDWEDYTNLYNEWVIAVQEVAMELGIPTIDLKMGGPYSAVRCEATRSNATESTAYPYGYYRVQPFAAIEYWLEHAIRADFVAFDCGSGNAVGGELTDTFTVQKTKFVDIMEKIRDMTDLPVVITEFYPKCADDQNANPDRVAAAKMVGNLSCIYAGYWMMWEWGAIGQGEYHEINQNGGMIRDYKTGEVNPWYLGNEILCTNFVQGTPLFPCEVVGDGIYAVATDQVVVLISMVENVLRVRLRDQVHVISGYEIVVIR
jgi:hypothetical protein